MNMSEEKEYLNEVAKIDQELGVQYCAESREIYINMLDIYLEQVDKYMVELPLFLEQKDWKNFAIAVHALKSTSLTIGAEAFSEKAKEMELAAKGEEEAFILSRYERFMEEYKCVIEAIQEIVANEKQ